MINKIYKNYFLKTDNCNRKSILKNETGQPTKKDSVFITNMFVDKIKKEYKL